MKARSKKVSAVRKVPLILTMQLKVLALRDAEGRLMNRLSSSPSLRPRKAGSAPMSSGNARVVRARLATPSSFYE